jgi:hypothetical protein
MNVTHTVLSPKTCGFWPLDVNVTAKYTLHSQLLFATRLCFLFCNQLVIRRAVEIESLQLVRAKVVCGLQVEFGLLS